MSSVMLEKRGFRSCKRGEDELRVLDGMTDVVKGNGLGLQALAVCGDGGVALHHGMKLVEEEDGMWLLVGAEDLLDRHSKVAAFGSGSFMARSRTESLMKPRI
jgi:hypothetical protein